MRNAIDIYREQRWLDRSTELYSIHQELVNSGDDPDMEQQVKLLLKSCEAKLATYSKLREVHAKTVADNFMLGLDRIVKSIK